MKKLALYVCEICGTQYSDQRECVKCEKRHKQNLSVKGMRYDDFVALLMRAWRR